MFYDVEIKVLDKELAEGKTIMVDLQPFDKIMKFEDGIELEIISRVFCDREPSINNEGYFLNKDTLYKVMNIKTWSDYLEIWLYECNR